MALSDLYKLGPCIVSALPDIYVENIDPFTFVSYFSTLGNAYQPSQSQITIVQSLIGSYASNTTLMRSSTQETLAFSTLNDLALFYPFSTYAKNISTVCLIILVQIKKNNNSKIDFIFKSGQQMEVLYYLQCRQLEVHLTQIISCVRLD